MTETHFGLLVLYDSDFSESTFSHGPQKIEMIKIHWSVEVDDLRERIAEWEMISKCTNLLIRITFADVGLTSGLQQKAPIVAVMSTWCLQLF